MSDPRRRRRTTCGTTRTASSTTCCTCPTAAGMPLKVRSMVGLIPLFAVETLEPEMLEKLPGLRAAPRVVRRRTGPTSRRTSRACARPATASGGCCRSSMRDRLRRVLQVMLDERSSCRRTASALCRGGTRTQPYALVVERPGASRRLRARRVDERTLRRQLELARADLVPGQLPAHRVAAEVPPLPRRRLHGRVPDRVGPDAHALARSPTSSRGG